MKITLALAALFILILGGGYLLKGHSSAAPSYTTTTQTVSTQPTVTATSSTSAPVTKTTTPATDTYTKAQVATHNSDASCWTIINGNVYDLTKWIGQHPGGPEHIESICGIDGTSAFEGQHGGESQPNAILATFKIGTLAS